MLAFIILSITCPFTIMGWIHEYKLPKKTNGDLIGAWLNVILYVIPVVNIIMYIAEQEHEINDWLMRDRND